MSRLRLVLKIGSSTLTRGEHIISRGKIEDIARQILDLKNQYDILIVSSGAIATAKQSLKIHDQYDIAIKQALAAIGQPILMRIYQEVFQDYGLKVAQCLLSHSDFEQERSRENTANTLEVLLENGFVPIINENDTTATEEIQFGDNDYLAALLASLVDADLLVLASDIDGLYESDPRENPEAALIPAVHELSKVLHMAGTSTSHNGTGGMSSKLKAARHCMDHYIHMWIVNGGEDNFLLQAITGTMPFTRFVPKSK